MKAGEGEGSGGGGGKGSGLEQGVGVGQGQGQGRMLDGNNSGSDTVGNGAGGSIIVSGIQSYGIQAHTCWWCGNTSSSGGHDVTGLTPTLPTAVTATIAATTTTTSPLLTTATTISTTDILPPNAATFPLTAASTADRPIVRILSGHPQ